MSALRGLNPRSGDASPSNGNVKLSLTQTGAKWQLEASNGKPKMSAKNRAEPTLSAAGNDGERTPPLAAGTVDNSCLSKTSSGGDRDLAAEIPCSLHANSLFLGKNTLFLRNNSLFC